MCFRDGIALGKMQWYIRMVSKMGGVENDPKMAGKIFKLAQLWGFLGI
jgi:hypothetical protein